MLWPLVLIVLAATIEAGEVKSKSRKTTGVANVAKSVREVKTGKNAAINVSNSESIDFNLINGTEADIEEFPFYAMLSKRTNVEATLRTGAPIKLLCGSSLIHSRFLISAWHCFKKDRDPKNVVAVFHITNRCKPDVKGIAWHDLQKIHFYRRSITNRKLKRHDLVLIELLHEVTDVSPLLMPSQPPTVGTIGTIIGFGRTAWSKKKTDDQVPCTLRKTFETVEVWENCRHPGEKVTGAFCGVASTTTACRGDSGGPWLTWNNGAYELQGIVSFGSVQCDANQANDHYTNVFSYKDWIYSTIRNSLQIKKQGRTSSAILEPNELEDNLNGLDIEKSVEQKYTARAPIQPQYLYPNKEHTQNLQLGSEPFNHFQQRSRSMIHPQNMVQAQPFRTSPYAIKRPQSMLTPYLWAQEPLQTPLQFQPPQLSQTFQQLPIHQSMQFPQQEWQQLMTCYGLINPPPFCFPRNVPQPMLYTNQLPPQYYQQQPSTSSQQSTDYQQQPPIQKQQPRQHNPSAIVARSVASNTSAVH